MRNTFLFLTTQLMVRLEDVGWLLVCTYFLKSSPMTQTTTKKSTIMHIMTRPRNIPNMST